MTSAQTMPLRVVALALAAVGFGGCARPQPLTPPLALAAPYSSRQVWAVVPFSNESGVSSVAGDRIADAFTMEIERIDGIDALPVNRVITAMRRLNLHAVNTPAQARSLLSLLGVDGLIVGTVTAYDPYQPPRFGAAIALFTDVEAATAALDPIELTRARTEIVAPGALASDAPTAQASGVFDASHHDTLQHLDAYAAGRSEPASAFGTRIYAVRMDLYTQFAAYRLLNDLLELERGRLVPTTQAMGMTEAGSDREMTAPHSR